MSDLSVTQLGTLTLETSFSLLLFVIAVKIYKMRVHTESGCCGSHVTTDNPGASDLPTIV